MLPYHFCMSSNNRRPSIPVPLVAACPVQVRELTLSQCNGLPGNPTNVRNLIMRTVRYTIYQVSRSVIVREYNDFACWEIVRDLLDYLVRIREKLRTYEY